MAVTERRARTEAWVVGEHELPADMPRGLVDGASVGCVVVRSDDRWSVLLLDEFERKYVWL